MNPSPSQQLDQQPVSYWQLCLLLLLVNSLALTGWVDFRQTTVSGNSNFVAEFNQLTLANHRDHFRSLLDIKNLAAPTTNSDGDAEQYWLNYPTEFNYSSALIFNAVNLHYLALLIIQDGKYHLPINRAPPRF